MSQSHEIAKEIVIAAIQSGHIAKGTHGSEGSVEKANALNVTEITKFYQKVYTAIITAED